MVKKFKIKKIEGVDNGSFDINGLKKNFSDIEDVINDHEEEIKGFDKVVSGSISYAVELVGETIILHGGTHCNMKVTNAFVQLGDSLPFNLLISIKGITNTLRFSNTEKAGKLKIFNIWNEGILLEDDIVVETDSDRKCIVNLTWECVNNG